jgi:hypothetical protein
MRCARWYGPLWTAPLCGHTPNVAGTNQFEQRATHLPPLKLNRIAPPAAWLNALDIRR